jgi:Dipeptidyl aminopeptidases/acylaminoacyl-peptidases
MRNWGVNNLEDFHTVSVKFYTDRKPYSQSSFMQITCPVLLVHCSGDIAYPVEYAEELWEAIHGAGVDVQLVAVQDASHFGNVTHAKEYVMGQWKAEGN